MINPINESINTKTSLEPVEVPHFSGAKKASKLSKTYVKDSPKMKFKGGADKFVSAAKKGTKTGVDVIVDVTKKSVDFTKAFAKSICSDTQGIIKEKGAKAVSTIDNLV